MKKAVIFDLDGVIVTTDEYHYMAWKRMADEERIYFDRKINEYLRGVSRMESLEIILKNSQKAYSVSEKVALASKKNKYYRESLNMLSHNDILPGVMKILNELREKDVKTAIGSSSKNAPFILKKIGLKDYFDAVADGNRIKNSKPDPEVFLLASKLLNINPADCVVVEDAEAGIDAANSAGMKSVGIGSASKYEKINLGADNLLSITADMLIRD